VNHGQYSSCCIERNTTRYPGGMPAVALPGPYEYRARGYTRLPGVLLELPDVSIPLSNLFSANHFASSFKAAKLRAIAETCRIEEKTMDLLWTLAVILLILWLLGLVTSFTLGGFIHILLVVAIIVVLIRVIQGRRPIA